MNQPRFGLVEINCGVLCSVPCFVNCYIWGGAKINCTTKFVGRYLSKTLAKNRQIRQLSLNISAKNYTNMRLKSNATGISFMCIAVMRWRVQSAVIVCRQTLWQSKNHFIIKLGWTVHITVSVSMCLLNFFCSRYSYKMPALHVDPAARQHATTHCQKHPGIPRTWECHVHRASEHVASNRPDKNNWLLCLQCCEVTK